MVYVRRNRIRHACYIHKIIIIIIIITSFISIIIQLFTTKRALIVSVWEFVNGGKNPQWTYTYSLQIAHDFRTIDDANLFTRWNL